MTEGHDQEARRPRAHLIAVDERLATIITDAPEADPYVWEGVPLRQGQLLQGLVLHIISQQITTRYALDVFGQLEGILDGEITATGLAGLTPEQLRALGMSGAKARSLSELGQRLADGEISLEAL